MKIRRMIWRKPDSRPMIGVLIVLLFIVSGLGIIIGPCTMNASAGTVYTWNAPANGIASLDTNWNPVGVPTDGDSIIFDGTSTYSCTAFDISATFLTFNINAGYVGGTVTLSANFGTSSTFTMAGGTLNGAGFTITCAGNFAHSAGTISPWALCLVMTGDGTTLRSVNGQFSEIEIQANVNQISNSCSSYYLFSVSPGKTYTIGAGINHQLYMINGASVFSNLGTIAGGANSIFRFVIGGAGINPTVEFGNITTTTTQIMTFSGGQSCTLYAAGDTELISALTIFSIDPTHTATLDLTANNYSLRASGINIETRGILKATNSSIKCAGSWTSTLGTTNLGTSIVNMTGTSIMTTSSTQSFYDLRISGRVTAASSFEISHNLSISYNCMLTIGVGYQVEYNCSSGGVFSNQGTIAGSGTIIYSFDIADATISFGTHAIALLWIWCKNSATSNRTLTMTGDSLFAGSLQLNSSHATNWMIFDTTAGNITVRNNFINGTRGMVYYSYPWTIDGFIPASSPYNYEINSAGSSYYAKNMITGLIEFTDLDYADNVTQYAIDNSLIDLHVNFANGTYVYTCGHSFYVSWNCSVYLNTTHGLTISGSGSTVLKYREDLAVAVGAGVTIFFVNDQSENLTIQNLEFEISTGLVATFRPGIFLYHPTGARPGFRNLTVENCTFDNLNGYAIWGDGMYYMGTGNRFANNYFNASPLALHNLPSYLNVSGNTFLSLGISLFIDSISSVEVWDNTFIDVGGPAIQVSDDCMFVNITNNLFEGDSQTYSSAILVDQWLGKPDCDNTTIEQNTFSGFQYAIKVESGNDTIIQNNSFIHTTIPIADSGIRTIIDGNLNYSYGASFSGTIELNSDNVQFPDGVVLGTYTTNTLVNITLDRYLRESNYRWLLDSGLAESTITFTLSNLNANYGYTVYIDNIESYKQLRGHNSLIIVYDGPWSEHSFEVIAWTSEPSSGPTACFEYRISGNVIYLTDKSYGGAISWIWNFGDGFGSTSQSPTHKYLQSGVYRLSLTVYDEDGRSSSAQTIIEIVLGPENPIERTDTGWNVYFNDQYIVSLSAIGLMFTGAVMFLSGIFLKGLPILTSKGRIAIGILLMIGGAYYFIFVNNTWLSGIM